MAEARGSLLIAAVSGRSLARAAADAGYTPLVADFFADRDTQEIAFAAHKLSGDIACGFQGPALNAALKELSQKAHRPLLGVIYGSGFEDRTSLLAEIAKDWPLIGNDPETVAQINAPKRFFAQLDALAIPYPATRFECPGEPAGWLMKRPGGAGGSHIQPAERMGAAEEAAGTGAHYYQAMIPGRTLSALFVANGAEARILGISEQWTAPSKEKPWRYGGAARPASLETQMAGVLGERVSRLAAAFGLKGLGSADFVIDGTDALLLEINPRPGGTLDIFAHPKTPLLGLHINAVLEDTLPPRPLVLEGGAASGLVFAPKTLTMPEAFAWPPWSADRPHPLERIDKDRPICTVLARAASATAARALLQDRHDSLLAALRGCAGEP